MVDQSPLMPESQTRLYATRPQQMRAYIGSLIVIGCSGLPIITLLPYFKGHTCKGIPSAYACAILLTVLGFIQVPGKLYNMYMRVKLGQLPSPVLELSGKRDNGLLCELYKGQLMLIKFDQTVFYLQCVLGTFWFFPLAMKNIQYLHDPDPDNMVNPEEHCNKMVFTTILAFGCMYLIFTCLTVLVLLAIAVGLIKKPPNAPVIGDAAHFNWNGGDEKTPIITDFTSAL